MLDLTKFCTPTRAVVPVYQGKFQNNFKKYQCDTEDGWAEVELTGDSVVVVDPAPEIKFKAINGYTNNNLLVFQNFDVARRLGFQVTTPLRFNTVETFTAVQAVLWEDNNWYYKDLNYSDSLVYEVQSAFDAEQPLGGLRGVTPELRILYLFHALAREKQQEEIRLLKELQSAAQAEEENQRQLTTISGRLQQQFEASGAVLLSYSQSGDRLIIDWSLPGGDYKYNTVVDSRTWMCIETGICVSNDDQRHNLTALIKTVEQYEDEDLIYITRR